MEKRGYHTNAGEFNALAQEYNDLEGEKKVLEQELAALNPAR